VPKRTERTEATAAPSPVVPANSLARWDCADQANRGQSSALTCRVRHHSGWLSHAYQANTGQSSAITCRPCHPSGSLSLRRQSKQRPKQLPHLSCPPTQSVAEPSPTGGAEARAAPSLHGPATKVAVPVNVDRANGSQSSALTCRVRQYSGWMSPHRQSDQRPEQHPCRACQQSGWLSHAYQAITGQSSAINCRPRHPSCWLNPRRPREQRPEQRPHLSCPQPRG
jgi:hypothetical protein